MSRSTGSDSAQRKSPDVESAGTQTTRATFRDRLERSEIYFRTIAALALAFMSVVVAWEANRISRLQAQIAERVLEIQVATSLGQIDVIVEGLPRSCEDSASKYGMEIVNSGAPCREVFVRIQVFLELDRAGLPEIVLVPTYYYDHLEYTFQGTGTLCSARRMHPDEQFAQLARDFESETDARLYFHAYVEVGYTDATNRRETECFRVGPGGVWRLPPTFLEAALENVQETFGWSYPPTRQDARRVIIDTSWPTGSPSQDPFNPYRHNRTFSLVSV